MDQDEFPLAGRQLEHFERAITRFLAGNAGTIHLVGNLGKVAEANEVVRKKPWDSKRIATIVIDDLAAFARKAVGNYGSLFCRVGHNDLVVLLPSTYLEFIYLNRGTARLRQECHLVLFVTGRDFFFDAEGFLLSANMSRAEMFFVAGQYAAMQTFNFQYAGHFDFVEFGSFDGSSMSLAFWTMGRIIPNLRLVSFDTFCGIAGSLSEETSFPEGDWAANLPSFLFNMALAEVDPARLHVIPGNIIEVLRDPANAAARLNLRACGIAHIDCDVYEPTKAALDLLKHTMCDGGLILFDDFDTMAASNKVGERRAVAEFLNENPDIALEPYRTYGLHGRSFILQRT